MLMISHFLVSTVTLHHSGICQAVSLSGDALISTIMNGKHPECKSYDRRALCLAGPQSCSRHPKVSWSVPAGEIRLTRIVRSQVSECSRLALALGCHYEGGKSKRMPPQRS